MDDLISRQEAIDGLDGHQVKRRSLNDWQVGWNDALDWVQESYLEGLPSAEPEIIRCKDCCHYPSKYADCPMIGWARNENDFCSKAERKDDEKKCERSDK